ncbi:type IV pilin protein [Variovorax boronicumulans]|uniref:type IV pilin protein n=1 Tax=Variovorax boronicumulans TaxID=436515 RepID=UPI0009ED925E|nr:type IV pilin protein [Variovorax boronicumulans]
MTRQQFAVKVAAVRRRSLQGFTLIELMIVVAVIGILAAIALPSYNDYVRRGQLPEAFNTLSAYRATMEQYYQDNRNYGPSGTNCAANAAAAFTPSGAKYFGYTCSTSASQQNYVITATGSAGRAVGHTYTINQNGDRATTQFKGSTVTQPCWLTSANAC